MRLFLAALLGAIVGASGTWFALPDRAREEPVSTAAGADERLIARLDALSAALERLAAAGADGSPVPVAPAAIDETPIEPTREEEGATGPVDDSGRLAAQIDGIERELAGLVDALARARESLSRGEITLHQRMRRSSTPNWDELERFAQGSETENGRARAVREIVFMTREEVLERFGAPTEVVSPTHWEWEKEYGTIRAGDLYEVSIHFQENGLAYHVDVRRKE